MPPYNYLEEKRWTDKGNDKNIVDLIEKGPAVKPDKEPDQSVMWWGTNPNFIKDRNGKQI